MLQVFERDFDDRDFILVGDFNDNPDDRSLNILETGDPNAPWGPEEIDGPFMVNLTEPLMAIGHVSHGKGPGDSVSEQVNTLDPASRQRNNLARGTSQHTGMILFDQILIPVRMRERYVDGSTKVFNHASALRGSEPTRASDCLPVFADLCLEERSHPRPRSPRCGFARSSRIPTDRMTGGTGDNWQWDRRRGQSRGQDAAIAPGTGSR